MKSSLLLLLFAVGCAPKKQVHVTIPRNCMSVTITDFTKPCKQLDHERAVCDGVIVHVSCVRYEK